MKKDKKDKQWSTQYYTRKLQIEQQDLQRRNDLKIARTSVHIEDTKYYINQKRDIIKVRSPSDHRKGIKTVGSPS